MNMTEGAVNLVTNTDSESYSEKVQEESKVWQKSVDKGSYAERIEHTEIFSQELEINAQTINVEILEQGDIQASITELAKDPKLAYLKDLQNDPNINWTAVQEAHESWNYEQEGLTAGAAMLISLAVGIATEGSGAALGSTLLSSLATAGDYPKFE